MVSETVNPEHIIFVSRIEYGVAIFLFSLEDCSTICSNDLSEDGNFSVLYSCLPLKIVALFAPMIYLKTVISLMPNV